MFEEASIPGSFDGLSYAADDIRIRLKGYPRGFGNEDPMVEVRNSYPFVFVSDHLVDCIVVSKLLTSRSLFLLFQLGLRAQIIKLSSSLYFLVLGHLKPSASPDTI